MLAALPQDFQSLHQVCVIFNRMWEFFFLLILFWHHHYHYYYYYIIGTLYTYLACGVGRSETVGAFRALTRGYNHWASGRLDLLQVNTMHPDYCHVRGTTKPSMKPGTYQVYLLLSKKDSFGKIKRATCECAAG